jgi:hypothetical protein
MIFLLVQIHFASHRPGLYTFLSSAVSQDWSPHGCLHALDRGYYVTVISKEWASYGISQRLTLQIFGALWEPPPTQCGGISAVDQDISEGDLKTVQTWAL